MNLLDIEFSFGQQMLLSSSQFQRECERRGIKLWPDKFQVLRRAGLLIPLYRFERDMHRAPSRSQRTRPYRVSEHFRNEIVWQRTASKGDVRRKFGSIHDVILTYSKSDSYVFYSQSAGMDYPEYIARLRLDDRDGEYPTGSLRLIAQTLDRT